MTKDCKRRKIDLILVKSISRFGRDTLTIIKDIRRLKNMNIGVCFEVGGFNTLTANEVLLTNTPRWLKRRANPTVRM